MESRLFADAEGFIESYLVDFKWSCRMCLACLDLFFLGPKADVCLLMALQGVSRMISAARLAEMGALLVA